MQNIKVDWDLKDLYKTEDEVLKDFEKIKNIQTDFLKYKGKLKTRDGLLDYLKQAKELEMLETKFGCYLFLRKSLNGKDLFSRKLEGEYQIFSQDIAPKLSFITPEISSNKKQDLLKYAGEKDFEEFNIMLEDIVKDKKHILNEKISAVLNKNASFGGFGDTFDSFNDVDLKFGKINTKDGEITLTHANYSLLIRDEDTSVRKQAYNMMHKAFADFNYTLGNLYLNDVQETMFFTNIKKYKSVLDRCCNSDKTSPKVLQTLIETVRENVPLFYKFEEIKKKALNIKDYYYFDNYIEMGKVDKKYTYEEAVKIVLNALEVMGSDYINVLKTAISEGWIDVYEKPAKTSGGFCLGVYGHHPYVLLNHTDEYSSVSTLAHELGHAMHSYYTDNTQPITKSDSSIFACEVASIVNEILLVKHMLKTVKDKQEKIFFIHQLLSSFYSTLYRQTMFSEFEHFVYTTIEQKKPLIVEDLNEKYKELQSYYFGEVAKATEYSCYEWSRIPHFYRPYYVYKYSTGFISACTIAQNILMGDREYLDKYKKFLSSGSSVPPIELLKTVGVDLTKKKTLQGAFDFYKSLLAEFEELTKE